MEITEIENDKQVRALVENTEKVNRWVREIEIKSDEDRMMAEDAYNKARAEFRNGEKLRDYLMEKPKEEIDRIRELFAPKLAILKEAVKIIGDKLLQYSAGIAKEAEEEKKKVLAKVEAGKMKIETAVKKIENVPEPQKTNRTEASTTTYRDHKKVLTTGGKELDEYDQILIGKLFAAGKTEYLKANIVKIRQAVLGGIEIAGTKIVVEKSLATKNNY